jgi:dihydrofolate reductase
LITIISACSRNRIIGKDNQLIWNVPGDLKRFKELTTGNPIIMGRKTFDSIGKPLPNRRNIVITRDKSWRHEGCLVYDNLKDAISDFISENIFIIGGGEIYKMSISLADKIELTLIDKDFDGDTYFPEIDDNWIVEKSESHECPDFSYHYITYVRK